MIMWNLFSFRRERHYLSAEEAKNILRYGFRNITLNEASLKEIDSLELKIRNKSMNGCSILSRVYPINQSELVESMSEHFKEKGFITDIYKNEDIPGFMILVIGW